MKSIQTRIIHVFEIVAAIMMAAMFATFILQVTIRYTARAEWIKEMFPFLDPT
jgi:C4-dicarboxylate transporter DctQ subunit